jgi:hypothetical protein
MLPKAVARRKTVALEGASALTQSGLDGHLRPVKAEPIVPFSNELFQEAATEWLISTDQPIRALEHPAFQKMINIAARATKGVSIGDRKVQRTKIVEMYQKQMNHLRERLIVSSIEVYLFFFCKQITWRKI